MASPETLTEYYKALSPERAKRLRQIQRLIKQEFPKANVSMKYKMPTFETSEKNWLAMASQKSYVSVYTCSKEKIAPFVRWEAAGSLHFVTGSLSVVRPGVRTGRGAPD